jgi:deoxyribodipyrimidine photo-lyase
LGAADRMSTPSSRLHALNARPVRAERDWVLYWMVASRRTRHNPGLQRAVELAHEHRKPLVVLEALRAGYRWASPRFHRFVMDGMDDNAHALNAAGVTAIRYLEPRHGAGKGLLEALAARSVAVVTDLWPSFFVPHMQAAVADRLDVRLEAVDGVGLLPLSASGRAWPTAANFRRHLQKTLPLHFGALEEADPLAGYRGGRAILPAGLLDPWPSAGSLAEIELTNSTPVVQRRGGPRAARAALDSFLSDRLDRYADDRKHPDGDASSGLSPYLHFGHLAATEVVRAVWDRAGWSPVQVGPANGSRGWWGLPEGPESFLDELVTWRELGHAVAYHAPDTYDRYESVPAWARQSLAEHASDARQTVSFQALEAARSGDPIWDAAQRQLLRDGHIHNYLRMLWGKKVLGWAPTPELAFEWLTELNNRYALDGRDPNSATGIAWIFGRHDRPWGPKRPVFGAIRYMTSENTERKLRMRDWLADYASSPAPGARLRS